MFSSKISGSTSKFYTDLFDDDDETSRENENNKSQTTRNSHLLEQQSGASEDGNSQDSDSTGGVQDEQNFPKHPYNRISRLQSCPRFQSFLVTTSNSSICTEIRSEKITSESSFVKVSHSVLEYNSSR